MNCEVFVSSFDRFPRSALRNDALQNRILDFRNKPSAPDPQFYCAYNQTREQFLCAHVELADPLHDNVGQRLSTIKPGCVKGVWLAPFRGISDSHVDSPIDLIFLDQNYCVLALVESFPKAQPAACDWPAGTALALPAQSIATSGTCAGDQLVLCSPEKMKRRFLNLSLDLNPTDPNPQENQPLPYTPQHASNPDLLPPRKAPVQVSKWEELRQQPRPAVQETLSDGPIAPEQFLAPPEEATPAVDAAKMPKNWLVCMLTRRRRDKRKASRESLPWIAAYFFNGSLPAPVSVGNISSNGMFIKTTERWYLGTIVHVTLSDWRAPSLEKTVRVNAMAVRWAEDGVGLRFIFPEGPVAEDDQLLDVTPQQIKDFLKHFKSGTRSSDSRN